MAADAHHRACSPAPSPTRPSKSARAPRHGASPARRAPSRAPPRAGMLDCFEAGGVALASGVASPACLVTERGAYSLADWLGRMERHPSAARQKATLRQLLEAVTYLHGRGMARAPPHRWPGRRCRVLARACSGPTLWGQPYRVQEASASRTCSPRAAWKATASAPARPASAVGSTQTRRQRSRGARAQLHRDIQAGNVTWCDAVARWRLDACGSWARKGADAALPSAYALRYAAPEVRPPARAASVCRQEPARERGACSGQSRALAGPRRLPWRA